MRVSDIVHKDGKWYHKDGRELGIPRCFTAYQGKYKPAVDLDISSNLATLKEQFLHTGDPNDALLQELQAQIERALTAAKFSYMRQLRIDNGVATEEDKA